MVSSLSKQIVVGVVGHILICGTVLYTLHVTRFRTYKTAWPPQDKYLGGEGPQTDKVLFQVTFKTKRFCIAFYGLTTLPLRFYSIFLSIPPFQYCPPVSLGTTYTYPVPSFVATCYYSMTPRENTSAEGVGGDYRERQRDRDRAELHIVQNSAHRRGSHRQIVVILCTCSQPEVL